jgi:catechol 2,3-dioxygenase-like lactoylglutathione lyase family enzyme
VFDHVTLRVSDLEAARAFYEPALATLGFGKPREGDACLEWRDLSIAQARDDSPVTRRLHVGLAAPSREHVDEFWHALTAQGFRDDGTPGLREQYAPGYYGAFVLDPDDNSIEAVRKETMPGGGLSVDHVWLRVQDVAASRRFYETIAPILGFWPSGEGPGRASFGSEVGGFTVTAPDEGWSARRPLTQNAHLVFAAPDLAAVEAFQGVAAGSVDPDGNRVEAVARS